jgi:SM-20-related protein
MPPADFFSRLGLFVVRGFLDPETCARLRAEAAAAEKVPGAVGGEGSQYRVDPESRRTGIATVTDDVEAVVAERLSPLIPEIARHFSVDVEGRQSLQFLVYGEGDFFEPHRDRNDSKDAAAFSKGRQVTIVIYLNGESGQDGDGYAGGALTFYGLLAGGRGDEVGLPLAAEPGLLVAFDSSLTHAVSPITRGERYTVVTWLV